MAFWAEWFDFFRSAADAACGRANPALPYGKKLSQMRNTDQL